MERILARKHLSSVERVPPVRLSQEGLELMDRNERTVDFPFEVMEELRSLVIPLALRAYPEPEPLYEKLAQWLGVRREEILLTAGADGALRSVFETYVEPGETVVTVWPSYAMYPVYCRLAGAFHRQVQFGDDLSLELGQILEQIDNQTKLVVLANPNQPIERIYTVQELDQLLDCCQQHGSLLVMDEAYYPFGNTTALTRIRHSPHLIVVRSFSKAFGVAGLRLGYLASQAENVSELNKVRPMYEVHSLAVAIGLYLLNHEELMWSYVRQVRETTQFLVASLERLGLKASGQWTNAVLVALPLELPAQALAQALKAKGILVRSETTLPLTNHLRMTVGSREQAERFLRAFESTLAEFERVRVPS